MSDPLQRASAFFAGREWPHAPIDEPRAVEVSQDWSNPPFKSYAQVKDGGRVFVYYSVCPERPPPERRGAVSEYLMRVNFGLLVGAFEMDVDDGEIRFRTSVDLGGGELTEAHLAGVVYPNHQAMIDYLYNLLQVIRGEQSAADAFREATEGS